MRNTDITLSKAILLNVDTLPYFSVDNLKILDVALYHLRIVLSRLEKAGKIIRLKKGLYVSARYIDATKSKGMLTAYTEFVSNKIYAPCYLSLEYVLHESNVLTDVPTNYTLVTRNKTYTVTNKVGVFVYHNIKDSLFCGYGVEKKDGYLYHKADRVKALFDFLYFRKNIIINRQTVEELRLNLEVYGKNELRSLYKYADIERSAKMRKIFNFLF
jgi:predicted transcriptional regulator of viral defense system